MLLMELKTQEKFAFLQIAHHLVHASGDVGVREKMKIDDYCVEMGIDNIIFDNKKYNIDDCLAKFKTSKSQKILLLELMLLAHVDDKLNKYEQDMLEIISKKFNINEMQLKYASTWGKAVSALRKQALLMINDT